MTAIVGAEIETTRLRLIPLQIDDAVPMLTVLADPELYVYIGGVPPTLPQLENQYRSQVVGSRTPGETWLNWVLWLPEPLTAIGYVQATVIGEAAEIAWVVGAQWQRQGFGSEAAIAMGEWLGRQGVAVITAHVHPQHLASQRVAAAVGLNLNPPIRVGWGC